MYNASNELQIFFSVRGEPEGIDVLDYWKQNKNLFPILSTMARDIFAVPVSTVPSESCFSSANRILTDKRLPIFFYIYTIFLFILNHIFSFTYYICFLMILEASWVQRFLSDSYASRIGLMRKIVTNIRKWKYLYPAPTPKGAMSRPRMMNANPKKRPANGI